MAIDYQAFLMDVMSENRQMRANMEQLVGQFQRLVSAMHYEYYNEEDEPQVYNLNEFADSLVKIEFTEAGEAVVSTG